MSYSPRSATDTEKEPPLPHLEHKNVGEGYEVAFQVLTMAGLGVSPSAKEAKKILVLDWGERGRQRDTDQVPPIRTPTRDQTRTLLVHKTRLQPADRTEWFWK